MLDERVRAVLQRLEQDGRDPRQVTRTTGQFLFSLVAPQTDCEVLEIGGSRGYSSLWLGAGVRYLGGRVLSLENDAAKAAEWRGNVEEAGLTDWVELVESAYAPALDDETWGKRVTDFGGRIFGGVGPTYLSVIEHDAACTRFNVLLGPAIPIPREDILGAFTKLGADLFRALWYPPAIVSTQRAIYAGLDEKGRVRFFARPKAEDETWVPEITRRLNLKPGSAD